MMGIHSCGTGMMDSLHPHTVLSHLSEQRSHGLFCDVTIVVEDIKFRAHRNVLAATSGYFRNAFTSSPTCTPSHVLEIPDLKSDVFSTILDFIYSSRVESAGAENHRSIVAAGKKLGIPFLEKLQETERQDCEVIQSKNFVQSESSFSQTKLSGFCTLKNEGQRAEEQDCSKGPRITNAFSITEVPEVHNPFTPLDLHSDGRLSPDIRLQAVSGNVPVDGESVDAMSEHSYAVNKGLQAPEEKEKVKAPQTEKRSIKHAVTPSKNLSSHRLGPIKKRHRKLLAPVSTETSLDAPSPVSSPVVQKGPPDSTSSDPAADSCPAPDLLPPPEISPSQDLDPPALVPEDVPTSTTYRCLQCPEAFSSAALLAIHTQNHNKQFVSHLFCKYCRKKFIHLKRLRNHEQVCTKGPAELEPGDKSPSLDTTAFGPDLREPLPLEPLLTGTPERPLESAAKPSGRQRVYKCSMCKRAYVTLSSLKRHENVHSWQRAYPCHYCNKVFALAEYRTKHEIWHTGERRYQCIFCLETFLTYYILRNHQKSFHGVDPRLTVNKKSTNGGFKGSVYPIKLYRLLPMKFRKKRYKSYNHTYSDVMDIHESSFCAPLDNVSQAAPPDGTEAVSNSEHSISVQSLFPMPVTFMATPKMMATELPRITFNQIQDKTAPSDEDPPLTGRTGFQARRSAGLAGFEDTSVFSCRYTPQPQRTRSSENMSDGSDVSPPQTGSDPGRDILPFLNIPPVCSFEGLSKLSELSAAAQTIEVMANQLLQPPSESQMQNLQPDNAKTETYIAKPACPGPSVDSHVLPLCQITVKIGNEAIIRRKIKGSKLFPKKKRRHSWAAAEDQSRTEDEVGPNLRLRTDVTNSVAVDEPCDDVNDPENDKLWRPYYSYKPKRKGKRLRSRQKRVKNVQYYTKPLSPDPDDQLTDTDCSPEESVPAERFPHQPESEQDFTCRRCSRSFLTRSSLCMHIISCHQPRCRTCAKLCPVEELRNAEAAEDYVCRTCTEDGSCFSSDVTSRSLSSEKRYRCLYCPQRFLYLATKKSHEAKHLEKFREEHGCRFCPKVCKSATALGLHESKHFGKVKETKSPEIKSNTKPYSPSPGRKEQPEPELWSSSEGSTFTRKLDVPRETSDDRVYPKTSPQKQTSFGISSKSNRSSFLPDLPGEKSKKKSFLELSKDFSLKSSDQNPLKIALSNRFKLCPPRPPAAHPLQPPKLEWRMFKQEPYD